MKILISGLGGDIAQSIVNILRDQYRDIFIYGIDISSRNASRLYCDEFHLCPKANDSKYVEFVKDLMENSQIDFFIPCTEVELRAMSNFLETPQFKGRVVCCGAHVLNMCLDKLTTYTFLKSNAVQTPWFTLKVKEIVNYPCIYKKRSSSGAKDIFKVKSADEAEILVKLHSEGLFQEYLVESDQEITCAIFRWGDEHFQCIQLLRELKDGSTSWAKKVENEDVYKFCQKIAKLLNFNGSINIQLRLQNGLPMILEINPRFSSTVYMRHLLGFKDLVWTIEKYAGRDLNLQSVMISEKEIVKTFNAVILK